MSLSAALLPEFDQEMAGTRRVLERIPDDKLDWRAHPKSNTIGWVATHLANIPHWVEVALTQDSFDVAPPGGQPPRTAPAASRQQILGTFDKNVAVARSAIAAATDEKLGEGWTLLEGGRTVFTLPRSGVLRSFVLNHMIHHRAILCVYLRLNDIPVPALYGPSADEHGM